MSDDHDADAISAYNKRFISTPNMDRIAKGGMRFTNCFVGNSICSPVRATVLTGQHSHLNGIKITEPHLMEARSLYPSY
jgi:arylsulfatase A-like enzyme